MTPEQKQKLEDKAHAEYKKICNSAWEQFIKRLKEIEEME